jgi:hypothetical protein
LGQNRTLKRSHWHRLRLPRSERRPESQAFAQSPSFLLPWSSHSLAHTTQPTLANPCLAGIPFNLVDSNPAKKQAFAPGPTNFYLYPTESDRAAGANHWPLVWQASAVCWTALNAWPIAESDLACIHYPLPPTLATRPSPGRRGTAGIPWGSGRYPFPPNASVEGAFPGCRLGDCSGDRHVIALDSYTCMLYEGWLCDQPDDASCEAPRALAPWRMSPPSRSEGTRQGLPAWGCRGAHWALACRDDLALAAAAQALTRPPPIVALSAACAAAPWRCANGAAFNLSYPLLPQRPLGWTSADAAGLPIYPGLIKVGAPEPLAILDVKTITQHYQPQTQPCTPQRQRCKVDEVLAGTIGHAIRFTAPHVQKAYAYPATHLVSGREWGCRGRRAMRIREIASKGQRPVRPCAMAITPAIALPPPAPSISRRRLGRGHSLDGHEGPPAGQLPLRPAGHERREGAAAFRGPRGPPRRFVAPPRLGARRPLPGRSLCCCHKPMPSI